ncbi:MAG: helix-turn-helix transcriptional regulator [Fibrobacterota bacterium]|nr:helix-turn-helix transcriptional regulator [Fibrobacterota bacterium]
MAALRKKIRSHCPINFGLEAFGDKWSLLILRDIVFRGKKTYGEFLKSKEGFATNILASRLEMLEQEGILRRRADPEDGRKDIHILTEKGLDLIPVIFELILWSAKYDPDSEAKRITRLVMQIQSNNRGISRKLIAKVRLGGALLPEYLD